MLCGLQLVESVDSGPQLHITNYKVTLGFLTAKRVGAPNPCVGQASTVFQWPPSQSPSFHPFLLEQSTQSDLVKISHIMSDLY